MLVERVPLDLIFPSHFNVRQEIDADSLTYSIDSVGQIEPLRVKPVRVGFEIRTGMRRFLSLKQAGATTPTPSSAAGSESSWTKGRSTAGERCLW